MPLPPQARRVAQLPPYLFVEVTRKINEKRARGEDVISLAIGDPDLPSAPHVISALVTSLEDVANHRYPESDGLPAFRRSVADWYKRRFNVEFDPDTEVLPTIGSRRASPTSRGATWRKAISRWCPTPATRSTASARCWRAVNRISCR